MPNFDRAFGFHHPQPLSKCQLANSSRLKVIKETIFFINRRKSPSKNNTTLRLVWEHRTVCYHTLCDANSCYLLKAVIAKLTAIYLNMYLRLSKDELF